MQGINPMVFCAPWADYKNKHFVTKMKIKQTTLIYNTRHLQEIKRMVICAPWYNTYLQTFKLKEL